MWSVVYKATVTETTSNNQDSDVYRTNRMENLRRDSICISHLSNYNTWNELSTTLSDHVWKLKKNNRLQYFMAGGQKSKAIRTKYKCV